MTILGGTTFRFIALHPISRRQLASLPHAAYLVGMTSQNIPPHGTANLVGSPSLIRPSLDDTTNQPAPYRFTTQHNITRRHHIAFRYRSHLVGTSSRHTSYQPTTRRHNKTAHHTPLRAVNSPRSVTSHLTSFRAVISYRRTSYSRRHNTSSRFKARSQHASQLSTACLVGRPEHSFPQLVGSSRPRTPRHFSSSALNSSRHSISHFSEISKVYRPSPIPLSPP